MNASERTRTAGEYVEWLRLAVHEKDLPANDRVRAAAPCLGIAQDHHHAIVFLIENNLFASSFALLRVAFEAYVRGEWLAHCAKDDQCRRFLKGWEPPAISLLLKDLETTPAFIEKLLSSIKLRHWNSMCAYTHTGGLHAQRWIRAESIEPTYDSAEIQEVLFFAEVIGSLSVIGFATLANNEKLALSILGKFKSRAE